MVNIPPPERKKKPETYLNSFKDAQALVEAGHPEGWDQVVYVIPKSNKFGLGFNLGKQSAAPKASILSTLVKFSSSGFSQDGCTNAIIDNEDSVYNIDDWICPSGPGQELNNWTSVDTIQVTTAEE